MDLYPSDMAFYASDIRRTLKGLRRQLRKLAVEIAKATERRTAILVVLNNRYGVVNPSLNSSARSVKRLCRSLKAHVDNAPTAAAREIPALKSRIDVLTAEAEKHTKRQDELTVKLRSAPPKPRIRSVTASIAAVGSRKITQKFKEGFTESARVWEWAMEAASETAEQRYNLSTVPQAALSSMKRKLRKYFPKHKSPTSARTDPRRSPSSLDIK
jgi:hypothetical protein